MNIRRRAVSATLAITLIGIAPAWSQSLLKTLDPDNDGTVDLTEAKTAAGKLFDKLDRDHDSTLDRRELRGRLNARDFAAAIPTTTELWTRMNFLRSSKSASRLPIPTMDGTIDAKEFRSAAGRSLVRLLK